jgi:hypothetical protein
MYHQEKVLVPVMYHQEKVTMKLSQICLLHVPMERLQMLIRRMQFLLAQDLHKHHLMIVLRQDW